MKNKCMVCLNRYKCEDSNGLIICFKCSGKIEMFGSDIDRLKRAILYLKCSLNPPILDNIVHGVDCQKAEHYGTAGYLHAEDDDAPYDVDHVMHCGRCHIHIEL